jgi:uncharacterized integral membrane protein
VNPSIQLLCQPAPPEAKGLWNAGLTDTIFGMNKLMWLLKWTLKAAIFFTLFAFALNNQHDVMLHFFFGHRWQAPMALVVLAIFALGVAFGFLSMVWTIRGRKKRQADSRTQQSTHGI